MITIFPESFTSFLETSIIGRAKEKGLFEVHLYKLNDFSKKKFGQVDDKAFGMHGQVLSPEPLADAIEHVFQKIGKKIPVIYFTPDASVLTQEKVEHFYNTSKEYCIICGHYEGIDQRIRDIYVDHEISIGQYVLSGGELASQIFLDSIIRHIPEVLGNPESLREESFSEALERKGEYPVYTRPQVFLGHKVPDILVSGNHQEIEKWKYSHLKHYE